MKKSPTCLACKNLESCRKTVMKIVHWKCSFSHSSASGKMQDITLIMMNVHSASRRLYLTTCNYYETSQRYVIRRLLLQKMELIQNITILAFALAHLHRNTRHISKFDQRKHLKCSYKYILVAFYNHLFRNAEYSLRYICHSESAQQCWWRFHNLQMLYGKSK